MRYLVLTLLVFICVLQWTLWFGNDGIIDLWESRQFLASSEHANKILQQRNDTLRAEVIGLQTGFETVEDRARSDLGLIKKDETFFQLIEPESED